PTTVVGSYPQPEWLVDREMLGSRLPPRVRAREIWRVAPEFLEQAQDDATLVAIRDMERAGIDIITDGEVRREGYSNRFATALAEAVNEEVRDLFAAGADVVQLDEPYLQARSEKAERFAVRAINRALEGVTGTTALHTCFGYAHIVHNRPNGYPFLEPLADVDVRQISIESAQQKVDLGVLRSMGAKTVIVGVIDLSDESPVEDVDT